MKRKALYNIESLVNYLNNIKWHKSRSEDSLRYIYYCRDNGTLYATKNDTRYPPLDWDLVGAYDHNHETNRVIEDYYETIDA